MGTHLIRTNFKVERIEGGVRGISDRDRPVPHKVVAKFTIGKVAVGEILAVEEGSQKT